MAFAANGADTWNTTPGSALWSASGNWATGSTNKPPISGDSLVFGASTVTTLTDDLMTPGTFNIAGITFSAGAPSYTINSSTPGTNGFTLTGGITNSGTNLETINDAIAITASRTITMTTGGGNLTLGGNISGTGGQLTTAGTGTLTLSGNNTFTGAALTNNGNTVTTGLILNANGTVVIGSSNGAGTGAIALNTGTLAAGSGGVTIANEVWTDNANGTIGGTNALTINGLFLFGGGNTVTVNNSALTTLAGGIDIRDNGTTARTVTFNGSGTILVNSAISNGTGGAVGSLAYSGTGTLQLSGTNTYTGTTAVTSGAISLQSNGASTGSGISVASGGALQLQNNITTTNATALNLKGTGLTTNGALENVSGNNTYTGLITLGAAASIGSDAGTLTISNAGTITGATFGLTLTGAGNGSLASIIGTTTGTLTKSGTGQWTLSGANTYTGTTSVSAGTLDFATEKSLYNGTTASWTTSKVLVSSGATYAFKATDTAVTGAGADFSATDINTLKGLGVTGSYIGIDTGDGNFTYSGDFGSIVAGQGLAKLGANTLTLTGTNTYTGGTIVNAGTLTVGTGGTLGSGALAVNNANVGAGTNVVLNLSTTSGTTVGSLSGTLATPSSGSNTATINNGGQLLTVNQTTAGTYAGVLAGTGGFTLGSSSSNTLTLTGANTYTGATTINAGTLLLGTGGSLAGTALTANTGGTLKIGSTGSTASTTIGTSGSGSVAITGGGLNLVNGALNTLNINNSTSGATAFSINGGTLSFDVGGVATNDSDQIVLASGLLASLLGSNSINLTIIGSGLNGVQQQLISWSGESGLGTFTLGSVTGSTGGYTLSFTANSTGLYLNEASTSSAYWKGGTSASWSTIGNFTTDLAGTTPRSAALDGSTSVTFVASGASNISTTLDASYVINNLTFNTGGVTIANGTCTNTLTIASAADGVTVATGAGSSADTISANVVLGGSQSWSVVDSNSVLNVSGVISDGGSGYGITKTGAGTLNLSGLNSYSGATTVSGGTLIVGTSVTSGANGALGNATSAITLGDSATTTTNSSAALRTGGAVTIARAVTIANQATTGTYSIGGNTDNNSTFSGAITANQSFNVTQVANTGSNALSITGGISGASTGTKTVNFANVGNVNVTTTGISDGTGGNIAVTQTGAGTTTFSAANSYTGGTTVSAGKLALSGSGNLGNANNALTVNGGTVDLGGTTQGVGNFTGTGGTVLNNATGTNVTFTIGNNNGTGGNFAGSIADHSTGTGTVALTKVGTGTLTLSGANSYSGATTVSAGALNIQNSAGLGNSSGVTVATGSALQLTGGISTTSAVGLSLIGTGVGGNGALENVSGNNTYSGLISLAGATTLGSDTVATTLTLSNTGTIAGTGGALTLTGIGNGSIAGILSTSVTSVTKTGTGTWALNGANLYTGATNINAGTLSYNSTAALSNSTAINLGTSTTNAAAGLNYTGSGGTFTTALNFGGTGALTLGNSGTGAINYSGTPNYTGTAQHTVVLGNTTDAFGGSIGGIADTAFNVTNVTKAGLSNSTWVLTGNDAYSGTTTVTGGVLSITDPSDLAPLPTVDPLSSSYIVLNNNGGATNYAVLQTNGTISRALSATNSSSNLNWGSNAGFAAKGGSLTLNFNSGSSLQWGVGSFMGSGTAAMVFGSTTSDNQVILQNGFDFGASTASLSAAFNRTIDVEGAAATIAGGTSNYGVSGNSALISGVITANYAVVTGPPVTGDLGNNGFVKTGSGTLILSGANTYSGGTTINGGTIIAGGNALLSSGGTFTAGVFGDGHTQTGGAAGAQSITLGGANVNSGDGNDGTAATGASPTVLIGGAYTVGIPITVANIATTGTYGIGGSTNNNATFSGTITLNQGLTVTQAATTGTNALNLTGGSIVGSTVASNSTNLTFNNVGAVNVGDVITDGAGAMTTLSKMSVVQSGAGTTTFTGVNTYTGTTSVNAGKLYVNNASGSGTGSNSVNVSSGATLAGNGFIKPTTGTGVTLNGKLSSGGAQNSAVNTITGTGLTLDNSANLAKILTVNSGSNLTFNLGYIAGNPANANNFSAPISSQSTFLNVLGNTNAEITFTAGGVDTITLVDLTVGSGQDLALRYYNNPYLLIQAGSDADYSGLYTTGTGHTGDGYVLGVANGLGGYNAFTIQVTDINGNLTNTYTGLQLYLFNGDLEVVPEPSTWVMMLGGLALLVAIQRRKNKLG